MANTFTLIASSTVGSGGASSITFSSIPQTYTDLKLELSGRSSDGNFGVLIRLNNALSTYTGKFIEGVNTSATSYNSNNALGAYLNYSTQTANTFSSSSMYIANYTTSSNKSNSVDTVQESNSTSGVYSAIGAKIFADSSAITSIVLTINTLFVQYTTATLYGIKKN
jgi:hypothetical protein